METLTKRIGEIKEKERTQELTEPEQIMLILHSIGNIKGLSSEMPNFVKATQTFFNEVGDYIKRKDGSPEIQELAEMYEAVRKGHLGLNGTDIIYGV